MLDINLFREEKGNDPNLVRESQRRRFDDVDIVDTIIRVDKLCRQHQYELDHLRKELNKIQKEIAQLILTGDDASELIESSNEKKQSEAYQNLEFEFEEVRDDLKVKLSTIGNLVHDTVPFSDDERNNVMVRQWGQKRMEPNLKNHVKLVNLLRLGDTEKGGKVAGRRGFYLEEAGVLLNQALINYGISFLRKRGYRVIQTPFLMTKEAMEKQFIFIYDEDLYNVRGDRRGDKYLISTAEQPLAAYHDGECLQPDELPKRYAGISTCFRKEAAEEGGSHGKDRGIFRTHQFEKVEQFCITSPNGNDSWEMLEEMITTSEEFYKELKIPYRVVTVVSGKLNESAAKTYDLEAWFPASNTYRELVSCSNCTDYQSRRLGIKSNGQYVHMLNSTLTATERTMCCILENYQTENGVEIPEVLLPYMDGLTFLPF
ncbi:hypothetical protein CCACVL1_12963 [Corchorus capsularis]|uniref:serine--tRNA ligase n=1 Tax=Corchorus capsularis TaxID=210143 RepID=A0A1R3ICX8_COCAP|nr:hypothetical protein CCACVL1_12963 [Corchorus capsularis]